MMSSAIFWDVCMIIMISEYGFHDLLTSESFFFGGGSANKVTNRENCFSITSLHET